MDEDEENVLNDILGSNDDLDGVDSHEIRANAELGSNIKSSRPSTRHIPMLRKADKIIRANGGHTKPGNRSQMVTKRKNGVVRRCRPENRSPNLYSSHSISSHSHADASSAPNNSNGSEACSTDDSLKLLEAERRRLEKENEEKKRELEELKRQERMMEEEAMKAEKRELEDDDKEAKRLKTAEYEKVTRHVSPVRSLNDTTSDDEDDDDDEDEDEEDGDEDEDEGTDGSTGSNMHSEESYTDGSASNDDDDDKVEAGSDYSSEEEEDDDENEDDGTDGVEDEDDGSSIEESGDDVQKPAEPESCEKTSVAISPIRWQDSGKKEVHTKKASSQKSDRCKTSKEKSSRDRRSHSHQDNRDEKSLKYIFLDAKYYLIKSSNHENVALAQAKGVWSTPPSNEIRLNKAFKTSSNVILIFSVKESGKFQGFARIATESDRNHPPIRWVLPQGLTARTLSSVFTLDWINRNELDFCQTGNLRNSLNENNPIRVGRDGQQIDAISGEALCRLFPVDRNIDLHAIALKSRETMENHGIDPHEEYKRTEAIRRRAKLEQEKRLMRRAERSRKDVQRRRSFPEVTSKDNRNKHGPIRRKSTSSYKEGGQDDGLTRSLSSVDMPRSSRSGRHLRRGAIDRDLLSGRRPRQGGFPRSSRSFDDRLHHSEVFGSPPPGYRFQPRERSQPISQSSRRGFDDNFPPALRRRSRSSHIPELLTMPPLPPPHPFPGPPFDMRRERYFEPAYFRRQYHRQQFHDRDRDYLSPPRDCFWDRRFRGGRMR